MISSLALLNLEVMQFQIAGLAHVIIPAFHFNSEQFAMVLTAPMLTCAILGIPAGALADRFGEKNTISLGLLITVISGFCRIYVHSFLPMFALMLLLGTGQSFLNAVGAKLLGAWFPRRQMSTAMGIFVSSASVGMMVALATSALFKSFRSAIIVDVITSLAILILWVLLVKAKPEGTQEAAPQPILKYIGVAAKSKNLWIAAVAVMCYMGAKITFLGFLPSALQSVKGANPIQAGLIASIMPVAMGAGYVLGPIIFNKLAGLKPFALATVLAAAGLYLAWSAPFGTATWLLLMISGLLVGTAFPILLSIPLLLPDIGRVYAGSAGGIISTLQMGGAFLIPSYIVTPLAGYNVNRIFLYSCAGFVVFAVLVLLLPDLGKKTRYRNM